MSAHWRAFLPFEAFLDLLAVTSKPEKPQGELTKGKCCNFAGGV